MPLLAVKIQIHGIARDPAVVVAHPRDPWHIDDWHHDMSRLPGTLSDVDKWAGGGAVIGAGDFNPRGTCARFETCCSKAIEMPPSKPAQA